MTRYTGTVEGVQWYVRPASTSASGWAWGIAGGLPLGFTDTRAKAELQAKAWCGIVKAEQQLESAWKAYEQLPQ